MTCQLIVFVLLFLLLNAIKTESMELSLKERIEIEPHSLVGGKSPGVEFSHKRFFSIPELGESSASVNFPSAKYALAFNVSSLYLDSIYSEIAFAPAVAILLKRIKCGVAGKLSVKDAGGEPFLEKNISASGAFDLSKEWQVYVLPPVAEIVSERLLIHPEWSLGVNLRYQPLAMIISAAVYQNVNELYGLRICQFWRAGTFIAFYGSFESDPLKISLGFSCFYRRLSAGVKFDRYPSIGSVQHYYTGYGSITP